MQNEQTIADGIALRCSLASMYYLDGIHSSEEALEDRSLFWERPFLPSLDSQDEDEAEKAVANIYEEMERREGLALLTANGLPPYASVGAMLFMLYDNHLEKGWITRKDRDPLEVRLTEKGRKLLEKAEKGMIDPDAMFKDDSSCRRCPWFDWCRPDKNDCNENFL
ncbi:MAG: hypothetical protein EOM17_09745 [Synergistales bacterium]|nr:hypothetical protein [Synergistales bacterium]